MRGDDLGLCQRGRAASGSQEGDGGWATWVLLLPDENLSRLLAVETVREPDTPSNIKPDGSLRRK